ncbi:JHBP [Nesidiocoris tenuis]|uniref:JHBP n=1 Tax=Nesidiocoris tenuis TaxID=355587 RepID=A0ABN7AGX5_9HEMI|nr:JHBP [Nesidiocoris tenuis]
MILKILLAAFLSLTAIQYHSVSGALPPGWRTCGKSHPDYNKCLKEAAQLAVLSIANNGQKKYGVFPADPLHFEKILLDQSSGPVRVKVDFSETDLTGFKNLVIEGISWNGAEMAFNASVPKLNLYGDYRIQGRVLVLPIVGQGISNITVSGARIMTRWNLPEKGKGKEKHFHAENLGLKVHGSKVDFHFTNLFNGDKRLGDNMNKFLNENWEVIWEEIQPAIQDSFGAAIKEISNRIFSRISSQELLPS